VRGRNKGVWNDICGNSDCMICGRARREGDDGELCQRDNARYTVNRSLSVFRMTASLGIVSESYPGII
jgi:hypothetical protein